MKRVGNLMPRIADMDNLREAFLLAVRGKGCKGEVIRFRVHLNEELQAIRDQLLDGSYRFGEYRRFMVHDPKERLICATPFRERVTFHAMMRVCHPIFEAFQINGSFASRPDLGTYKALERAQTYSRRYRWFLKMDVQKFFASIDHECMKAQLARLFKDRLLLAYFDMLIDGYEVTPGRGLPIGNLTSQYFANHYLAVADHYVKERLQAKALVRYMDDIVIWGNDSAALQKTAEHYRNFLNDQLHLLLHPFCMNQTRMGMPFLGYVVYPHEFRLNQRSRHRYRHRLRTFDYLVGMGIMSEKEANLRIQSALAFVTKANSKQFLRTL
ncbi:MAG: RNA-directed DNA polymerase [Bacteroidaceae bacterium]|nr:RNA-directed DNA polymerase [Bacteroidaceae bacterium]